MSMRGDSGRHDDAARAGWLYYVAGNTQDQIAAKLGVSRQSAQRLVSLAVSEGLIKVRLDHPHRQLHRPRRASCRRASRSTCVEVVPSDPAIGIDDAGRRRGGRRRDRTAAEIARARSCWRSARAAR